MPGCLRHKLEVTSQEDFLSMLLAEDVKLVRVEE